MAPENPIRQNTTPQIHVRTDIFQENNIHQDQDNLEEQNLQEMANRENELVFKMALAEIENFNGKCPDINTWIKQIEKAVESINEASKPVLLRLLRHKVKDQASVSISKVQFDSIPEFIHHFEKLFGKPQDYIELSNKIGHIYQFENETVLSYQLRLEDLIEKTKKAYENTIPAGPNRQQIIENFNSGIENLAKQRFRKGFLEKIECRLPVLTDQQTIGNIAERAKEIEEYLEKYKEMRQEKQPLFKDETKKGSINTVSQELCTICFSLFHKTEECSQIIQKKYRKITTKFRNFDHSKGQIVNFARN